VMPGVSYVVETIRKIARDVLSTTSYKKKDTHHFD
jgi:hypothetical protein